MSYNWDVRVYVDLNINTLKTTRLSDLEREIEERIRGLLDGKGIKVFNVEIGTFHRMENGLIREYDEEKRTDQQA